jgi:hypothetical protein
LSAFSPLITKPLAKIFTDTVISCSALLPATSVATMVTVSLCTDNGNVDEGITYSIKGTNANKFSITATGILTYKAVQTSVHNDTVTIVATDGHK